MRMPHIWLTDAVPVDWGTEEDPLLGHREESWRWEVLTLEEAPAGTLDGVQAGTLDFSIFNTIKGGGSLTFAGEEEPNWARIMLQPWYSLHTRQGPIEWPLGVFIPAAPPGTYTDAGKTVDVELYDKLLILDQDKMERTYTVPAGTPVADHIRAMIDDAGQAGRHAIEDSEEQLRNNMTWEAGTSRLAIINDLLDSINYFSLWCDGWGVYQGRPYQAPAQRPTARVFVDDEKSIYSPNFTHDLDLFNIPNKVIEVGRGDEEEEGLTAVATNMDPDSPHSYQARGRWITHVDEDVEATSQAVIDAIAKRRLAELSQTSSVIEFQHALVPMELNDIIEFQRNHYGLAIRATLQSFSISTATGALVQSKIREVTR